MTPVSIPAPRPRLPGALRGALRAGLLAGAIGLAIGASGCSTSAPKPLTGVDLAEVQTFPYFKVYWAGPRFLGWPLAAADGTRSYISSIGDSVYYGNCISGKGLLTGGNCLLPLQVTTVIYGIHSNQDLGAQKNVLLRGVPAVVYDGGHSIELYTERMAVDIFSSSYAHAVAAADQLYPINAPGSATANLPPPVFCPGLYGPEPEDVQLAMNNLPGHACQEDEAEVAFQKRVKHEGPGY
jgi:hypothetical protein